MLRSGLSILGGQGAFLILRLASTLIMTRLLVPEAFGVMALAIVVQTMASLLSDAGISQAIVQHKNGNSEAMLNTAWILQILRGAVIFSACVLVAVLLLIGQTHSVFPSDSVYNAKELPWVLMTLSVSAIINGFEPTKTIIAGRSVNYSRITLIEIVAQTTGLAFMIFAGYLTGSVWALVVGSLISSTALVLLSHWYMPGPANKFQFDRDCAKDILSFGRWILISSAIFVVASNGDRLLIGAWADAHMLGLYAIALSLLTIIDGTAHRIYSTVAYSALSETARERPGDFRRMYYRLRLPFDTILLLFSGAGFAAGDTVVNILYDQRYTDAGHVLQVLSLMLLITRMALCGHAYMALGQPKYLFPIHAIKAVSFFTIVPAVHHFHGFEAALWAIALHEAPLVPMLLYLNHRMSLLSVKFEVLILLVWPVGYLLGTGVSTFFARFFNI
jgi:O-antigen/teichoic acid export membrane protein